MDDPSLLGRFDGEKPAPAEWFTEAIAHEPERSTFEIEGAAIELLTWGEAGKPGLLFLHGNAAHADWWSFVAPFFADDYRCSAISWSGMGRSDWRERYSLPLFAREVLGAIDTARLASSGNPPVIVAHSFGGFPARYVAAIHPEAMAGAILVDSMPPKTGGGPPPRLAGRNAHNRYPTLAMALRRFKLMPEQPARFPEAVDWMARNALHEVPETDDDRGGWTWRFDPLFWANFERGDLAVPAPVPTGVIYGADSVLFAGDRLDDLPAMLPDCRFVTAIPDAGHHVMVDQPLALVAAIREGLPKLA